MLLISLNRTLTVMLHEILTRLTLLSCVNRTLTLMLHDVAKILTKRSKIKPVNEVLCPEQTRKIWCNNIYALHKDRNFCVGTFYPDSPCRPRVNFAPVVEFLLPPIFFGGHPN